MCRPPEGLGVSLLVLQVDIKYVIPIDTEVEEAVRGLKGGSKGGLLGMRA